MTASSYRLRVRSRVGKYRIEGFLGEGGFACVYKATDTIEGKRVALRVPSEHPLSASAHEAFLREIKLLGRLDHPNILPIRNADLIDGRLVVAMPMAEASLADRLTRRLAMKTCLSIGGQLLDALAYAHARRVVHCDVKPENVLLFPGNVIRLADFGLARVSGATVVASGSGTLGYMPPEQAMGRPSPRSDVFSAGLILYRMFSGVLPTWPFEWPMSGHPALERKVPPEMTYLLRRALKVNQRQRYTNAGEMAERYQRVLPKALAWSPRGGRR